MNGEPEIQWHQDTCIARLPSDWTLEFCLGQLAGTDDLDEAGAPEGANSSSGPGRHLAVLDSNTFQPDQGRYSYLCAWPYQWFELPAGEFPATTNHSASPPTPPGLAELRAALTGAPQRKRIPGLPPFQGGAVACLSFEYAQFLERLPQSRCRDFECPPLAFGMYDCVLAWDLSPGTYAGWVISQGLGASTVEQPRDHALRRIQHWWQVLSSDDNSSRRSTSGQSHPNQPGSNASVVPQTLPHTQHASFEEDTLHHRVADAQGISLTSNLSRPLYLSVIDRAVEHIRAGDIFQVNLAHRLCAPATCSSVELFQSLRRHNPAPYAALFELAGLDVVSSSPELFLRVADGKVESRPIKGTRRRSRYPEADLLAADELRASEKDRAENVMIVDLMRNDLSRVCLDESVRVTQLCEIEKYHSVLHLVSAVEGQLLPGRDAVDLLAAAFPGGSITGAPKIRAMEIIAQLEPTQRGPYCGSIGYIGFDGSAAFNILIRTITAANGMWHLPVGGGIVAQSDPELEYAETWTKAASMIHAIRVVQGG